MKDMKACGWAVYVSVVFVFFCPALSAAVSLWEGDVVSRDAGVLRVAAEFPRTADIFLSGVNECPRTLSAAIRVTSDGPADVKASAFLKDKDGLWYQTLTQGPFPPGRWKDVVFDLSSGSGVLPDNHFFALNDYNAGQMDVVGLKFFSPSSYSGTVEVKKLSLQTAPVSRERLRIVGLRRNAGQIGLMNLFELTLGLGRSFANPFDPEEVRLDATFVAPSGRVSIVPGFCYRDFIRRETEDGEQLTPKGRQEWKVRFTPTEAGPHSFYLFARAGAEEVRSGRETFEAVESGRKGLVRVCKTDTSRFELTTGEFFYPVGHNVRSPTDPRCAASIYGIDEPIDRGTFAYDGYIRKMAENGENVLEVWMASWWVGLEWTSRWKGYNGHGHYNMGNAWRLDHVIGLCDRYDVYMHLVLDNHGKASRQVDQEWADNSYNVRNGGFLQDPEEFFKSDRAKESHKKKLRYIVARWGHSARIMGFELWSEIDLTGSNHNDFKRHPSKREWHREMIRYLKQIDPLGHLCTTHYSGNYNRIDSLMVAMPEIDYIAVDAYRGKGSLIPWIFGTVGYGARYGKPIIITEYGGNPWGYKAEDKMTRLEADLHTGIWAGFTSGLAGTPFLWWFDFIERENLYYHFAAFDRFLGGEDLRGLGMESSRADVEDDEDDEIGRVRALSLSNGEKAFIWVFDRRTAEVMTGTDEAETFENIRILLPVRGDEYVVEFWDTYEGRIVGSSPVKAKEGMLVISVPGFKRDIACKVIPQSDTKVGVDAKTGL